MLKGLRKNAKRVLWPLTIACIIGMGGWGSWYYFQRAETVGTKTVGKVFGRDVPERELQNAEFASWILARLSERLLEPAALTNLGWERILLGDEAKRLGITVEPREVAGFIATVPFFQKGGRFDQNLFRARLAALRVTEDGFQEQMRNLYQIEKLRTTVRLQAQVSPQEVIDYYDRLNDKVRVEYVEINREQYSEPIPLKDDDLLAVYQQNQQLFQVPAQAEIRYIFIPEEEIRDKVTVGSKEIEQYYEENQEALADAAGRVPPLEEAKVRIENRLVEKKVEDEMNLIAEDINRILLSVEDLGQAAAKHALELKTAGPFSVSDPIPGLGEAPEINRAAFSLQSGEVSDPIVLPEGIVFMTLTKRTEPTVLTFEQAKGKIEQLINDDLTDREVRKIAAEEAAEVRTLMEREGNSFAATVRELGRKAAETSFFSREGGEDLPQSDYFVPVAFLTVVGKVSEPFPTAGGYAFLYVLQRAPAGPMPEAETKTWEARAWQRKSTLVYNDWFRNLILQSKLSIINPPSTQ